MAADQKRTWQLGAQSFQAGNIVEEPLATNAEEQPAYIQKPSSIAIRKSKGLGSAWLDFVESLSAE